MIDKIKGAIFDVDGTILDSMGIWASIGNDYLRSVGGESREDLGKVFKTFTTEEAARYYIDNYGLSLTEEEIVRGINAMIEKFYKQEVCLKTGAGEFLAGLKAEGVKMCLATASDRDLVEAALKRLEVWDLFDGILTCNEVGAGKENPLIFRKALELLGTSREETLVFEDAYHALKTAADDGFRTAAVYDSSEPMQEELRALVDYYITDYKAAGRGHHFLSL